MVDNNFNALHKQTSTNILINQRIIASYVTLHEQMIVFFVLFLQTPSSLVIHF